MKTKIVNSENILIVYVQWEHNGNEQNLMVCKCKTAICYFRTGSEFIFTFDDIYFYSTEQNPQGCCDGYMWDSHVDNCVGMYSTIG